MSKLFGGRYELGALIGAGGMADVFAATDTRLSREVAIKVLRSDLLKETDRKSTRLNSSHIPLSRMPSSA